MPKKSPEVTAYIAAARPFARPVLKKLRKLYHEACPSIVESMKWSAPFFEHEGIVGSMSAFKAHVSYGFWKGDRLKDSKKIFTKVGKTMMAQAKVSDVSELPPDDVLVAYIKEAVELNVKDAAEGRCGDGSPKRKTAKKAGTRKAVKAPPDLLAALKKSKKALAAFEGFPPSHKKEYVEWILDAKREETRNRRIAQAVEWMAEGKSRNWKYR